MQIFEYLKDNKGASIVLVTLMMVVLLSCTALVADVGLVKINQIALANALDAAALAGAQELPDQSKAISVAQSYMVSNGIDINNVQINVLDNNQKIKLSASRQVNLLFATVLGFNKGNIDAESVAQARPLSSVTGLVPLGLEEQTLVYGELYVLKNGAGASTPPGYHPGWFKALGLGKPGASTYESNLMYGYQGSIKIGDLIDIETGNMSGPTLDGVTYRLFHCNHVPSCTVDNFRRDCAKVVYVPVIKAYDQKSVKVVGFASFLLTGGTSVGTDSYIYGYFIKNILPGDSDSSASDYGLYTVKLIK